MKHSDLNTHPSRLLSKAEVAAFLGVSQKTVVRYHDRSLLPNPIRLAGQTLLKWRLSDIEKWINDQVEGA